MDLSVNKTNKDHAEKKSTVNGCKRALSQISQQYDPLGYTAPFLLKGRLILQQLAVDQMSWDEPVPAKHERAWKDWSQTLLKLKEISIPRWYFANAPQVKGHR